MCVFWCHEVAGKVIAWKRSSLMPIISPPKIVQNAMDEFLAPLFDNTPQRKHLANYLTGLMIAETKPSTV